MRESVYRIKLEIQAAGPQVQLTAKRGDSARRIEATLYDHGLPFLQPIPGAARAAMTVRTPAGLTLTNDCDLRSDGTVVFDFTALTVKELGLDECELTVYDGEGGVLTSPRFTILVDDTVFEDGQTIGAAWKDAVDRAKEQILETTDALETKTVSMPITFGTAAALTAAALSKGQMCATRGRWYENDGGARTYVIVSATDALMPDGYTLNPLALELTGSSGGLYAVPVITDRVTALDIGLRRGVLRPEDAASGNENLKKTALAYYADGAIPAENSRLLQAYIDRLPPYGADDTLASLPSDDPSRDYWGGTRQRMTTVYFPEGTWFFRDPVVIDKPVVFEGTYKTNHHNHTYWSSNYAKSRLIYAARELTTARASGSNVPGFVGDETGVVVREQEAELRGDQEYEYGNDAKQEAKFVEHALFYAACDGCAFRHLEFGALSAFEFAKSERAQTDGWGARPGDLGDGGIATAGDRGAAYNPFCLHRKLKGVNGIIFRVAVRDGTGRIKVKENGDVRYQLRSDGGSNSTVYWGTVEYCSFTGFSSNAIVIGDVCKISDCEFKANYVGIQLQAPDVWIDRIYMEMGLIGINTNSHTCFVYSSYIDMMAGFAVSATLAKTSFRKRTLRVDGGKPYLEHLGYVTAGTLLGLYDVTADYCIMGAYAAAKCSSTVDMRGRIGHCGILYCSDTVVEDKGAFGTQTLFLKSKDAYENPTRTGTATWDAATSTWTGEASADPSVQTFSDFVSAYEETLIPRYGRWKTAHIQLEPTKYTFYTGALRNLDLLTNVSEQEDADIYADTLAAFETYLAQIEAQQAEEQDETTVSLVTLRVVNEDETGIARYDPNDVQNAFAAFIALSSDTVTQAKRQGLKNRTDNYNKMIGFAAVNIQYMHSTNFNVAIGPRACLGKRYTEDGVSKRNYVTAPTYALHVINFFDTDVKGIMLADRTSSYHIRLQPIYVHGIIDADVTPPRYIDDKRVGLKIATTHNVPDSGWDPTVGSYGTISQGVQTLNLVLSLSHKKSGEPAIKLYGMVKTTANTNITYDIPSVTGVPAYKPFVEWFSGINKSNVFAFPLIAANQYPASGKTDAEHPVSVRSGDVIGSVIMNFNTQRITVHPQKDFYGEIMPIIF